ncbi:MAG TPA: hypothetical protein VMT45_13915 [Thermoanaerobaculaceae bacterium]|nr:hypothetical protein [Thermoanaerobaculaceae bacterium]
MKTVAVVCNAVLFAFTCSVLATDGMPTETIYKLFSLLLLLVPLLSFLAILHSGMSDGWLGARMPTRTHVEPSSGIALFRWATAALNLVLLANSCWAVVTQYPSHPKEEGLLAYVVVIILTPILNFVVLMRIMRSRMVEQQSSAAEL